MEQCLFDITVKRHFATLWQAHNSARRTDAERECEAALVEFAASRLRLYTHFDDLFQLLIETPWWTPVYEKVFWACAAVTTSSEQANKLCSLLVGGMKFAFEARAIRTRVERKSSESQTVATVASEAA